MQLEEGLALVVRVESEVLLSRYTRISMGAPHICEGPHIAMTPRTETRNWLQDMGFG